MGQKQSVKSLEFIDDNFLTGDQTVMKGHPLPISRQGRILCVLLYQHHFGNHCYSAWCTDYYGH